MIALTPPEITLVGAQAGHPAHTRLVGIAALGGAVWIPRLLSWVDPELGGGDG